jgi:ABC transport system ATP-binding/permease protein
VSGELLVNGQPRNEQQFQRSSCYITQEDLHQPLLTVREAMDVAARLKLPKGAKVHSEEILHELGLLEHQHTKTDKLSGGQKKRYIIKTMVTTKIKNLTWGQHWSILTFDVSASQEFI